MSIRTLAIALAGTAALAATPALANDHYPLPPMPAPDAGDYAGDYPYGAGYEAAGDYRRDAYYDDDARDAWLDECRARYRDSNIEGAIIGGVIGGIAGNRIAGRGNRRVGTVIGGAVGAAAGAAIDSAEGGRADECEAYLDRYMAGGHYGYTYAQAGHYGSCGCGGYVTTRMVPVTSYRFGRVEYGQDEIEEEIVETVMVQDVVYDTVREEVAPAPRPTKLTPTKSVRYRK